VAIRFRDRVWWPPRGEGGAVSSRSYLLTLDFADVDGRLECVRVELGWPADEPRQGAPVPVTMSALRSVPLGRIIDEALRQHTRRLRDWAKVLEPGQQAELLPLVAAAAASLPRAPGRPPSYNSEHFVKVADAYTKARRAGESPTKAVASRFHVSYPTAANWVARARAMGFLPPTSPGRAVGG